LLVRFKRAAEDLGSDKGLFGLLPGGDGSGLVYMTGDVVGVIMPMRSGALAVAIAPGRANDRARRVLNSNPAGDTV
jgi:hypothetical protein